MTMREARLVVDYRDLNSRRGNRENRSLENHSRGFLRKDSDRAVKVFRVIRKAAGGAAGLNLVESSLNAADFSKWTGVKAK